MKNRSPLLFACLGVALAGLPALRADEPPAPPPPPADNAGPGGPGGGGRHMNREAMRERREQMFKDLNLTADQQSKWTALEQQEREAMKALRKDSSVPDDQRRAKAKDLHKGFEEQRMALLTADQKAKFETMRANFREQGHRDGPPPPPPAPPSDNK